MEDQSLREAMKTLWNYVSKRAGIDKNYFFSYAYVNQTFTPTLTFGKKGEERFIKYPQAVVTEKDFSSERIEEQCEEDKDEESEKFYPPFDEQLERAKDIVTYAREELGLLQSNMAVVDLAYLIRYGEYGGEWVWSS